MPRRIPIAFKHESVRVIARVKQATEEFIGVCYHAGIDVVEKLANSSATSAAARLLTRLCR